MHWIGIALALVIITPSFFLFEFKVSIFLAGLGVLVGIFPFVFTLIGQSKIDSEKEEMFLEFSRNLVESVKTGASISKSIMNLKEKSYGVLSPHVEKLANQISLGIPLNFSLRVFSKDIENKSINRAITLIGQAEKAGGNIGEILESVAGAVSMSDKLKKERKSVISTLVVQGYIIFLIFVMIILVMQFQILPLLSNFGGIGEGINIGGSGIEPSQITNSFLYMLLIQGLFSGLTIGKLAEGSLKAGIKHSFAMILISFLISTGANLFF